MQPYGNRRIASNKMQCFKIFLKQSQISKQIISKFRKPTLVLYLVAHIKNIFIPAYFEKIMWYFFVHLDENPPAVVWKTQNYVSKRTIYYQIVQKQPILSPLFTMLYGWEFTPAFLTSPALSNGGGEETLGQKKKNFCFVHNIITEIV